MAESPRKTGQPVQCSDEDTSIVTEKKSTRKRKTSTVLKDFIMNEQKPTHHKPNSATKAKKSKRSIVTVAVDRLDTGEESEVDNEMESEIIETEDCLNYTEAGTEDETDPQNSHEEYNSGAIGNNNLSNGLCYKCSSCELKCVDLRDFLEHLTNHGYEKDQCPCCELVEHSQTSLALHVLQHIKGVFRRINYSDEKLNNVDKSFHCNVCETSVSQNVFFEHWQTHFTPIKNNIIVNGQTTPENEKPRPNTRERKEPIIKETKRNGQIKNGKVKQINKINGNVKQINKINTQKSKQNGVVNKKVSPQKRGLPVAERKKIEKRVSDIRLSLSTTKDVSNSALSPEMLAAVMYAVQIDTQGRSFPELINCVVCKRAFGRSNDTKRHLIEHLTTDAITLKEELESLRCQICLQDFPDIDRYKRHMRDHAMLPVFQCHSCDRVFSDASNYRKHKKKHDLEDLICYLCDKKCSSKAVLMEHVKSHEKQTKITCEKCNKVYYFTKAYKRHLRVHDKGKDKYQCRICWGRFSSIKDKNSHMKTVHAKKKT